MGLRYFATFFCHLILISSVEARMIWSESAARPLKRSAEFVPNDWSQNIEDPSFVRRNIWNPFTVHVFTLIHPRLDEPVTAATSAASTPQPGLPRLPVEEQPGSITEDVEDLSGELAEDGAQKKLEQELVSTKDLPYKQHPKRSDAVFSSAQYKRRPFDRLAARIIGKRDQLMEHLGKRPFDRVASRLIGKRNHVRAWWVDFLKNVGLKQENEKRFFGQKKSKILPFDSLANSLIGK